MHGQVVVASPLFRTLETACGVFGGSEWAGPEQGIPLMHAQTAAPQLRTAHAAIAAAPGPRIIAFEGCRERLGRLPGSLRRPNRLHVCCMPCFRSTRSLMRNCRTLLSPHAHTDSHCTHLSRFDLSSLCQQRSCLHASENLNALTFHLKFDCPDGTQRHPGSLRQSKPETLGHPCQFQILQLIVQDVLRRLDARSIGCIMEGGL